MMLVNSMHTSAHRTCLIVGLFSLIN